MLQVNDRNSYSKTDSVYSSQNLDIHFFIYKIIAIDEIKMRCNQSYDLDNANIIYVIGA